MKRILFCIVAGVCLSQSARASLLFYEPFSASVYTNGTVLGTGVGQWNIGASPATGCSIITNTAALSYSGLVTSNASRGLLRPANSVSSNRHAGSGFSPSQSINATNPTLYCSFLLSIQTPPSANRCALGLGTSTASNPNVGAGVWVNSSSQLLVSKNSTTPAGAVTSVLVPGTHLVVLRYKFNASSSDDEVALWLDPPVSSLATNEANVPGSTISTTANIDVTTLAAVYAVQGQTSGSGSVFGSASGNFWMDEIRVGTTWADVTPWDGSSGPTNPPAPPTTEPVITGISKASDGTVLRGINGVTNGIYQVLATTDIARPIGQWDALESFNFDSAGHFICTNPASADVANLYYRVLVNGSLPTAPVISDQPDSLAVVVGQDAAFSVAAIGGDPLAYQWYFKTNTPLVGKTGATLTITDVEETNEGAYSVVVSNNLGSVTSLVAFLSVNTAPTDGSYYVATTGDDSNPGSIGSPFATLPKAISVALPGDTIYIREGSYFYSQTIRIEKSGTPGNPINILAFPGEHPLLDFVNQPYGSNNRGVLFTTNGNYWTMKGIEIARAGDNGVKVEGSHLRFEQCVFHHNGDSGMQIGFGHPAVGNINLAAFVEVINCDSYMNYDQDNRGSDADGFAAKLHCGQGIVFIGCRSWMNSDDGWDLFETDAGIIISNCWTWHSGDASLYPSAGGSFQGNGNGFKLGGNGAGGSSKGTHAIYNSVSFNHKFKSSTQGFTQNSHKDGEIVVNCLSFSNSASGYNYFFEGGVNGGKANVFTNNVSLPRANNAGSFTYDPPIVEQNNSWNLVVTANAADYVNLTEEAAAAPRQADGSLPTGFARLVSGSDLIDKGVNVGSPFTGAAPDLGPYEYAP